MSIFDKLIKLSNTKVSSPGDPISVQMNFDNDGIHYEFHEGSACAASFSPKPTLILIRESSLLFFPLQEIHLLHVWQK